MSNESDILLLEAKARELNDRVNGLLTTVKSVYNDVSSAVTVGAVAYNELKKLEADITGITTYNGLQPIGILHNNAILQYTPQLVPGAKLGPFIYSAPWQITLALVLCGKSTVARTYKITSVEGGNEYLRFESTMDPGDFQGAWGPNPPYIMTGDSKLYLVNTSSQNFENVYMFVFTY